MSFNWIADLGFSGLLDIGIMALLIYTLLVWSKRTRVASALTGILIVSAFYLFARYFNLTLTAGIFERFFGIILIALVVIFQEELRYMFEQVALWSFNRHIGKQKPKARLSREEVDVLVRTLSDFSRERIGALIVLKGRDILVRHLDGGIDLGGRISEPLLKSLFDPHSVGHDGAVLIEGNKVVQFSCHLPLSKDLKKLGKGGTRHAAALGLAELSDALCLVVSEERGTISAAREGTIKVISDPDKLSQELSDFYAEKHPKTKEKMLEGFLKKNTREKIIALILAVGLWFVLVLGNKWSYKVYKVPVTHQTLPAPYKVTKTSPDHIYVTLSGSRNSFYFLNSNAFRLRLRVDEKTGEQTQHIYPTDIKIPENLSLVSMTPEEVNFTIEKKAAKS